MWGGSGRARLGRGRRVLGGGTRNGSAKMVYTETAVKLTYEDYASIPGDERYELIGGELILAAAPNEIHQRVSKRLLWALMRVEESGLGWVYHAPFDVVLSDTDVAQPDLLFVSRERADIITPANVRGAPNLVVEILSPSTAQRDWTQKRELYARYGVQEFWPIDPELGMVWVLSLRDGEYEIAGIYEEGQTLISPTIAGLTIDLGYVFGE